MLITAPVQILTLKETEEVCYFKKGCWNYSVITSVRSVEEACHTSDFSLTSYHLETKNLANSKYKKEHTCGKNCRKNVIIIHSLDRYIPHLQSISFPAMYHSETNLGLTHGRKDDTHYYWRGTISTSGTCVLPECLINNAQL